MRDRTKHRGHGRRPVASRDRGGSSAEVHRIYGNHAVAAWLEAGPQRIRTLYFDAQAGDPARSLVAQARSAGVAVQSATADDIAERSASKRHQGLVAECAPFPYVEIEDLIATRPRLVVVVDQLHDPHNLGAILRSAEAVGAGGLIAPKDNCVGVTAVAEASSAGASAWQPVARVTNLARALTQLKDAGFWIVGLSAGAAQDIFSFDPPEQVALLVGGEAGIRPLVARQVDFELAIPMRGHTESLNASVAAPVALYALTRGRPSQS
jgi:23S rRNA (guanosine2251-2'-O)-methyltransferase